jgi:mono/diheme cytochrome c family protein
MLPGGQLSSSRVGPGAILAAMRRPLLALLVVLAAVGAFTGGLAWLLDTPKPPPGASKAERLYLGLCATCHGADGRGSWRAALFLVRPGDLADAATIDRRSDQYLFDLIKHGGAPIGRPGMPGFGSTLSDNEIAELVRYVRSLSRER